MPDPRPPIPGAPALRASPPGMPDADIDPPVIAEADDPFTTLRVLDLVARIERGRFVRIEDIVAALNARHLSWLFEREVVLATCVALQANWFADYRNRSGIVLEEGPYGVALAIEDSPRVDPWIARQAQRAAAECRTALDAFSRRDG